MNIKTRTATVILAASSALVLSSCASNPEAATVRENMATAGDEFEVLRRIVFFNGITDTYLLTIEGKCAIFDEGTQLEVFCKISEGDDPVADFKNHKLGLSDNVSYFVEQLEVSEVDTFHHRVVFRPETIIPDVDIETTADLERDGNQNN